MGNGRRGSGERWEGQRWRGGRGKGERVVGAGWDREVVGANKERVGVAKARGGRGRGVRGVGRRCNTHYTSTWHQSMTNYPLYTQCTSPSSPFPHTSTHKGTTHSPSDVALAEVLM